MNKMEKIIKMVGDTAQYDQVYNMLAQAVASAQALGGGFMTNETRQTTRKMGTTREGYVRMIATIANNNVNVLPRSEDPNEINEVLRAHTEVNRIRGLALKMLEWAEDTEMALGVDGIGLADLYAPILQLGRKSNVSLDMEMKEVDEYNSRFGKQMEQEDNLPTNPATPVTPAA